MKSTVVVCVFLACCFAARAGDLSYDKRHALGQRAVAGDAAAAEKLAIFYFKDDRPRFEYWTQIAAENGSASGQYNYGLILLARPDRHSQLRGEYWLRLAARQGDGLAKQKLRELQGPKRK